MVSILIQSPHEELIHSVAIDVKNYLLAHSQQTVILGPARSAIYKMQDIYRERILIKFLHSQDIYEALCVMNDYYNKQQKGKVRIVCDFNPYSQI